jgi:hypothetical protein
MGDLLNSDLAIASARSLSLTEIKVALALTLQKFDFPAQFEEWDQMHGESGPQKQSMGIPLMKLWTQIHQGLERGFPVESL